ncbi:MAG: Cof-type HAD-IIB family hydrolase [Herbiconiux sp.]|nr:Cof-type HAD-IIB family hydrolase [Herbiconiux sp.]
MVAFFCDIDGTITDASRGIADRTAAAIVAVRAAGHPFVLCSSRMPASMRGIERRWLGETDAPGTPLVAYNGGLVLDVDGEVLHSDPIPSAAARAVFSLCARLGVHASFYSFDDWYAWADDFWSEREIANTRVSPGSLTAADYLAQGLVDSAPPHKIMCMGEPALIDELEAAVALLPGVEGYRSTPKYLELVSATTSKGVGMRVVAEALGVALADCVFFGDNHNDLPAFELAGTAVAVANARTAVLAAAHAHTARNHDDGVAQYLEHFLTFTP